MRGHGSARLPGLAGTGLLLLAVTVATVLAFASALAGDGMTFRVVDGAGKPVKGATVQLFARGGTSWTHGRAGDDEPQPEPMTTGPDGLAATVGYRTSHVCALAHDGKRAGWVCALTQVTDPIELRLGDARTVSLHPVDAKGKPVKDVRLRLVFSGGAEGHGMNAVEASGVHRFAPLPVARFDRHVHVEARANGVFVGPYDLPADAGPKGAELRLVAVRTLGGRVVGPDGAAVADAKVWLANGDWADDGVRTGVDGRFSLPGVPVGDGREILVRSGGFAPRSVAVPGAGTDVGDVALAKGLFLTGRVREADDARIVRAFITVGRDGQRVASGEANPGGSFSIGPLDEGDYDVQVFPHQSQGIAGWRRHTFRAAPGAEDLDVVVPTGLRVLLRDADGKPVTSQDTEIEIASPGRAEPWKEHFNASGRFSELRMQSDPSTEVTVTVRVAGYAPATGKATTDAEGRADLEMRLKAPGK